MNIYSEQKIKKNISPSSRNAKIFLFDSTDSTNSEAKRRVRDGSLDELLRDGDRAIFVSNEQTEGRGRMGRTFFSPPDTGIYMTVLYRESGNIANALKITCAAAVAVSAAIEKTCGVYPKIKWVNDLYLNEKKVCGILSETCPLSDGSYAVTVGMGINLSTENFPCEIGEIAGCVGMACDREMLVGEIYSGIDACIRSINSPEIMNEYRKRFLLLGRRVSVIAPPTEKDEQNAPSSDKIFGTCTGVDGDGALLLLTDDGKHLRIASGEVSIRM